MISDTLSYYLSKARAESVKEYLLTCNNASRFNFTKCEGNGTRYDPRILEKCDSILKTNLTPKAKQEQIYNAQRTTLISLSTPIKRSSLKKGQCVHIGKNSCNFKFENPIPNNLEVLQVNLSDFYFRWTGSQKNNVHYDLYSGLDTNDLMLRAANLSYPQFKIDGCLLGSDSINKKYWWNVIAYIGDSCICKGPYWSFQVERNTKEQTKQDSSIRTTIINKRSYKTKKFKNLIWMVQNLNNDTANSLFDWNAAKKVCTNGWHLPTVEEWDELIKNNEGKKMKQNFIGDFDNSINSSFAATPDGLFIPTEYEINGYHGNKISAFYWSASEYCEKAATGYSFYYNTPKVEKHFFDKNFKLSVRCVKDE